MYIYTYIYAYLYVYIFVSPWYWNDVLQLWSNRPGIFHITYLHESCLIWMSRLHMNASCHTWMRHVTHECVMSHAMTWYVFGQIDPEFVTSHMNKSCLIWRSPVSFKWVMWHTNESRHSFFHSPNFNWLVYNTLPHLEGLKHFPNLMSNTLPPFLARYTPLILGPIHCPHFMPNTLPSFLAQYTPLIFWPGMWGYLRDSTLTLKFWVNRWIRHLFKKHLLCPLKTIPMERELEKAEKNGVGLGIRKKKVNLGQKHEFGTWSKNNLWPI